MTEANIKIVLDRLKEIFEEKLFEQADYMELSKLQGVRIKKARFTFEMVQRIYMDSTKQAMRELCLTGCPYGEIWECKR